MNLNQTPQYSFGVKHSTDKPSDNPGCLKKVQSIKYLTIKCILFL